MQLVNRIFIHSPPATVWAFLRDPENMLRWNPNVRSVSSPSFSDFGRGYRFAITYQLSEKSRPANFQAEFVQFDPPSKLVIRQTEELASPQSRTIEEVYELADRDGGTQLVQTIRIEHSGINLFLRFLIWAVQKWGRPTGTTHLAILRETIEQDGAV